MLRVMPETRGRGTGSTALTARRSREMRWMSSGRKPEAGEPCAWKRASTGSGRGGEKRTERQRARRLLHQKNGQIVRQVVGYDRFEGLLAYRQLNELYRALRVYVNCFQPSMKLQAKEREESRSAAHLRSGPNADATTPCVFDLVVPKAARTDSDH